MTTTKPRRITGPWRLSDLKQVPSNGLTAFSCFHCGGGSTMGYKLAGFQMLGGVEIDPEMMAIYRANHRPKHSYLMGVQQFNKLPLDDLPDELKQLDLLDGSPPCSVFSLSGKREKKWGTEHHFREGQQKQRLDDLFMHFIEVGQRLQPKLIVAENVKGLILGNAKGYVKEIFAAFREAGYRPQLFLLNSAKMGVPQARPRIFFVASREDLGLPKIRLDFNEETVSLREALQGTTAKGSKPLGPKANMLWSKTIRGNNFSKAAGGSWFNYERLSWERPAPTVVSGCPPCHPDEPRYLSPAETIRVQSFPDDYDFRGKNANYVCGMSVPPFMTQRIALEIGRQWFGVEYE
jgi:DNA (cytosine-5)-methyltransferase 1